MPQLIHHWYWVRAEAGGYCVIASTSPRSASTATPGRRSSCSPGTARSWPTTVSWSVSREPASIRPQSQASRSPTPRSDYDATAHGGEHYRVTFRRQNTMVQYRMIESVQGPKRVLARIAGFDGAYICFTGDVIIERIGTGADPETVTAPALWELMYFGKTTPDQPRTTMISAARRLRTHGRWRSGESYPPTARRPGYEPPPHRALDRPRRARAR
jgi:hypothetical protein